jgi:exonuclease III
MSEQAFGRDGAKGASADQEQIKVLTFNIRLDGEMGLAGIIDVIRKSKADVVGLQESEQNAGKIAKELGFNCTHHGDTTLLTRFKIEGETPNGSGIITQTDSGSKFAFFDEHLFYKPYQPYQLLGIPYENGALIKTEAEAISEATKSRGDNVIDALKDIQTVKDASLPEIVVGDFNEPSHLDWTEAAAKAGKIPTKVEWPSTKSFADAGFKDSYREVHPDVLANPGYTWTPTTKADDPKDHHDRIDFILYRGDGIKAEASQIVGEDTQNADIVVSPFPSDHRAVLTTFEIHRAT